MRVPVLDFLALRFAIASVGLLLLFPRALGRLTRDSLRQAVVLGLLYGVAQILQTAGLAQTPASVSGFITGTYVVATPLLAAAAAAHPHHRPDVGSRRAGDGRAGRADAERPLGRATARRSRCSRRSSTPCTSSGSAPGAG